MALIQQRASDVRLQEINLSQVVTSTSSAVACQVIVSNQGDTAPKRFTTADDYIAEYGNPNAKISFDVYCGLDFFREGNEMWALRVAGAGAKYSAVLLYKDASTGKLALKTLTDGVVDPDFPRWSDYVTGADEAVALFLPKRGPGSYADVLALGLSSSNVETPTGLAVQAASTGGTLVAATYQYQISALSQAGETLVSAPATLVIAGGGTVTNSADLSWNIQPLAWGYRVYGRKSDAEDFGLLVELGQGVNTWKDTGALEPDTAVLPITDAGDLPPQNGVFNVNLFDTSLSLDVPLETWNCTLTDYTDDTGTALELEDRINPFSSNLRVISNVPSLDEVPVPNSVVATRFGGGDSGAAVTSFQVAAAWNKFANKQLYQINTLINGGHSDPNVQKAMDDLAQLRGDCTAMLDVPSAQQQFQQAINYRNLSLNLNSTYSALFCPDMLESDNINGKEQYVPFSGWAAALCARTDRVANPSFSIAGLNRGLVNVLKTRYSYDDGQASAMFRSQINYTRTFIGQGIALWEQQTLSSPMSALSWISVRRIVNVIKTALYNFGIYFIQEPNDEFTARGIVSSFSDYLENVKNARGLYGYEVYSDARNNSLEMTNSGIRRVTVVLIPTLPLHELEVQIVISKQGISFEETLRQVGGQ